MEAKKAEEVDQSGVTQALGKPLVGYPAIAEKFGVSTRTAESPGFLSRLGIHPIKVGRTVRFDPDDVRAAVERLKAGGQP